MSDERGANFVELRFGEVRVLGIIRSSLSGYRASTGPEYPSGCTGPNQKSAMDDKERQIDEMGEAREAQYALECVLVRLTEAELQRVIDNLPPRAREHIMATTAHRIRHLGE
jgi:hypothetical protein